MLEIVVNSIPLSRKDFNDCLVDRVAFDIAFASAVLCRDKEALLELLRQNAQEIIDRVRNTPEETSDLPNEGGDS